MCIPNRARHMYIHTMHVCASACILLYIIVHVPRQLPAPQQERSLSTTAQLTCMHSLYSSAVRYRRSGSGGAVAMVAFDHGLRMYTHPSGTSLLPTLPSLSHGLASEVRNASPATTDEEPVRRRSVKLHTYTASSLADSGGGATDASSLARIYVCN